MLTFAKGTPHAYLRGRHLHGTPLPLPTTHTGAILQITDRTLPTSQPPPHDPSDSDEELEDAQDTAEVKVAEQIGEFDEVLVWGHGGTVEEERDMFVRGVREWVGWAEAMHGEGKEMVEGKEETGK